MSDRNPQSGDLGTGPGLETEVPQATPTIDHGPDSHRLQTRPNPPVTDYEERYKGLNQWVTKEFNDLRGTVQTMSQQMAQLMESLKQPQAPEKKAAPAPVSGGKGDNAAPGPDALELAIQAKKAQQYRDMLLDEYEQATGLPLGQFRKHITVVPPTLKDDGSLDDSGQRSTIEDFVNSLKGLKTDAQKDVLKGHMPGSAPSAPQGAGDLVKELHDIMTLMGDAAWDELTAQEQATMEARYFELLEMPEVQEEHEGNLQPSMGISELSRKVRDLTRTVANLQGRLPANFA